MKRFWCLILTVLMISCLSACAKGTEGLEYYPLPDGSYGVSAGTALSMETIVIPSKYNREDVKVINYRGFEGAEYLKE